jgi:hypothetical protein
VGHADDLFAPEIFDRPVHIGDRHVVCDRSTE